MWHFLKKSNHRLTRTGTYINLKMNFLFFLFSAKLYSVCDFNIQYNYYSNEYKSFFMVVE